MLVTTFNVYERYNFHVRNYIYIRDFICTNLRKSHNGNIRKQIGTVLKNWQVGLKHLIQFLGELVSIVIEGLQYPREVAVKKSQQRLQSVGASLEYPVLYVPVSPHRLRKSIGANDL